MTTLHQQHGQHHSITYKTFNRLTAINHVKPRLGSGVPTYTDTKWNFFRGQKGIWRILASNKQYQSTEVKHKEYLACKNLQWSEQYLYYSCMPRLVTELQNASFSSNAPENWKSACQIFRWILYCKVDLHVSALYLLQGRYVIPGVCHLSVTRIIQKSCQRILKNFFGGVDVWQPTAD